MRNWARKEIGKTQLRHKRFLEVFSSLLTEVNARSRLGNFQVCAKLARVTPARERDGATWLRKPHDDMGVRGGVPTAALTMVRWPRLGVTRGHHGFGGPHRRHSLEKGASRDDFPARSACGESFCSEGRRACRGRQFCRCDRRQTPAWWVDDVGTGLRRTGRLIPRILALDRRVGRHRARNLWVGRIVGVGPGPRLVVRRKVCRHLRHPVGRSDSTVS